MWTTQNTTRCVPTDVKMCPCGMSRLKDKLGVMDILETLTLLSFSRHICQSIMNKPTLEREVRVWCTQRGWGGHREWGRETKPPLGSQSSEDVVPCSPRIPVSPASPSHFRPLDSRPPSRTSFSSRRFAFFIHVSFSLG